jgi:hypothetical protein
MVEPNITYGDITHPFNILGYYASGFVGFRWLGVIFTAFANTFCGFD